MKEKQDKSALNAILAIAIGSNPVTAEIAKEIAINAPEVINNMTESFNRSDFLKFAGIMGATFATTRTPLFKEGLKEARETELASNYNFFIAPPDNPIGLVVIQKKMSDKIQIIIGYNKPIEEDVNQKGTVSPAIELKHAMLISPVDADNFSTPLKITTTTERNKEEGLILSTTRVINTPLVMIPELLAIGSTTEEELELNMTKAKQTMDKQAGGELMIPAAANIIMTEKLDGSLQVSILPYAEGNVSNPEGTGAGKITARPIDLIQVQPIDENFSDVITYQSDGPLGSSSAFIRGKMKRTESPESALPAEPKKYSEAELSQMTPAEILAQAPELEGYEKWRAAGRYAMYLNAQGEVEKAYDMTIAEYRDIPEYPVTKPENFKNSEIIDEELFNGDYFLWLQKEAKKLSCSPDMRTDIPMGIFRGAITPNPDTAPNFENGGEFFIRDHTAAFTRFVLENGEEVHYAVMPVFMCDLNDPTNLYPIITVYSSYNLNTNRTQDSDNNLYMADVMPRWSNDMKVTPIVPNATMTYPGREGMNDPLVSRTFESLLINWKARTQEFMNGNWSAFSEPKMVFLNDIGTNKAHKYE